VRDRSGAGTVGKVGCGRVAAHVAGRCGCGRGAASAEAVLRARIVDGLADRFHARVELDSFHVRWRKGFGPRQGLRIWPPARVEAWQLRRQEGAKEAGAADPACGVSFFMRRSIPAGQTNFTFLCGS